MVLLPDGSVEKPCIPIISLVLRDLSMVPFHLLLKYLFD